MNTLRVLNTGLVMWLVLALFACASVPPPKHPQGLPYGAKRAYPDFPSGVTVTPTPEMIDTLRTKLWADSLKWNELLKYYYGTVYDPALPDLICYINHQDSVRIGMVRGDNETHVLYGARYLWVLIFSDRDLNTNPAANDTTSRTARDSVEVILEPLVYQREPGEQTIGGLIRGIYRIVFGTEIGSEAARVEATRTRTRLPLNFLSTGKVRKDSLYVGQVRFDLALNTMNRVVIIPPKSRRPENQPKFRSINYAFGNFERSLVGAGLGVGSTFAAGDTANLAVYLLGHVYIVRPQLPRRTWAIGVMGGTNVFKKDKGLLNDLVFGVRIGIPRLGQSAIIGGGNWSLMEKRRKLKPFVGIDYRL